MMEDADEPPVTPFWLKNTTPTNSSWIMSVFSVPSFNFRSFVIRQLMVAVTGLLINFFITPFLVNSREEDFKSGSLMKALVALGLICMLLAVIFGFLSKLKKDAHCQNCDTSSGTDAAAPSNWINPTGYGPEISHDYSVFTSFRFPLPDSLHPNQQRLMANEKADHKGKNTAEVEAKSYYQERGANCKPSFIIPLYLQKSHTKKQINGGIEVPEPLNSEEQVPLTASLSFWSKPLLSSSLSETSPSPLPPSYELQWLTSAPPSPLSPYGHQWLPSALPSPLEEHGKRKNTRTSRAKSMNGKASIHHLLHESSQPPQSYHASLLLSESASLQPASLPSEPKFPKQEADSRLACSMAPILNKRGVQESTNHKMDRNHTSNMYQQASTPHLGLRAWQFMEEVNFAKFKSNFAKFRNINSSFHASSKDIARNEATCNNGEITKSEANDRKEAPLLLGKNNQLQIPAQVQPVAKPKTERKIIDKSKGKKSGCLRRLMSSFCTQIMRRKRERQRTSRRSNQISKAPLSSSIHPFVATTSSISTIMTSSMHRGRNSLNHKKEN